MLRARLRVLILITTYLPLLSAETSHSEETSSISGRDEVKPASCGKDCEDRTRIRSRLKPKCELYYFAPTATQQEQFGFWNITRVEHRKAYYKIVPFLKENSHENRPIFFPAHMPLVEKSNKGREVLVLKDVYVRALGTCVNMEKARYDNTDLKLQTKVEMVEDYVDRMPRTHWGYRVPKAGENDVCLDDTGLVVKEFPGIRTCFSMWIFDDRDPKPKHFAGRQIYNRINQRQHVNMSEIGFKPSSGGLLVATESFSLAALLLNEMCHVTNESLENRCTYWVTESFYVSLCCCYTNRTDCAYKSYKFPSQKKPNDTEIRACATGEYYAMKRFGGNHEPKNASGIASSVKQFVRERTSSEVCKWTYTWSPSSATKLEDVLRVHLDTEKPAAIAEFMQNCTSFGWGCCRRTTTLCPIDANSTTNEIVAECFCSDGDLCNKRRSYVNEDLVRKFKETRPCETHTVYEHLLWPGDTYKKPNTSPTEGFMCPIFYDFAHPGRPNAFLQLIFRNNFAFLRKGELQHFRKDGCRLVEVQIKEGGDCSEKLFGEHDQLLYEDVLILLCSVQGSPLGANRTSYPDAELKKNIAANLTTAKEAFPTCKNESLSLDFESLSELVVDNSKLEHLYDNLTDGTNDNITTPHCFVEVSFIYQQQYNLTFGAVSIDDKPLHDACHESEFRNKTQVANKCVRRNSTAGNKRQQFTCCCRRHWNRTLIRCHEIMLDRLKTLLNENAIARKPTGIMSELKKDPLTKCAEAKEANEGHAGTDVNRPCARNEGCYIGVHARDVSTSTQHKEFGGCVAGYAPDAKKRDDTISDEIVARFSMICRLPSKQGQCFAVLGTEDAELPDDIKAPQIVCCCRGRLETTHKCGTSHRFGMKIGDLDF